MGELERILRAGPDLLAKQVGFRQRIRGRWKKDAGDLLDAHWMVTSVVAELVESRPGVPGNTTKEIQDCLSQTAAFIQGIDLTETTISEGMYVQAGALLRQEMETLAAIAEIRQGSRRRRKTPNVKHLPMQLSIVYDGLSAIAHVADQQWLDTIVANRLSDVVVGASIVPQYDSALSMEMYALHVIFVWLLAFEVIEIMEKLYGERVGDR